MPRRYLLVTLALMLTIAAVAQNRIDHVRPDAPELAAFGAFAVGVRTLEVTNPDQLDVVGAQPGEPIPRYDRPLVLEVWYPADAPPAAPGSQPYEVGTRDPSITATLRGRGQREAPALREGGPFPLVIVSHGYPGNRFLLAHLGENLASKGFVVVSIDHTDSTYADQGAFGSTLLNRSLDQLFVLDEMARLGADDDSFLAGVVDADRTGIIGYSMGGYGALNVAGAGYTAASVDFGFAPPERALVARQAGEPAYLETLDERVRAVVAIGAWGMPAGFWDEDGLAGIEVPVLFMAGSVDDVSGYEAGARALFEGTRHADRYLLTFEHANHNAAAPMAAPVEVEDEDVFGHYADAVWNNTRMNNVAQHFATAFFGVHLQADATLAPYLDLVEQSSAGVFDLDDEGEPTDDHTYWLGFPDRSAVGLRLEHAPAE